MDVAALLIEALSEATQRPVELIRGWESFQTLSAVDGTLYIQITQVNKHPASYALNEEPCDNYEVHYLVMMTSIDQPTASGSLNLDLLSLNLGNSSGQATVKPYLLKSTNEVIGSVLITEARVSIKVLQDA
jgi:hypothetical protein